MDKVDLETSLGFLKSYRKVLSKSGTAQDLRQIKHSQMNHRFPCKPAFSIEYRGFCTDTSFH